MMYSRQLMFKPGGVDRRQDASFEHSIRPAEIHPTGAIRQYK
jgi:hypothetical protein